jgi:hypothetical protein
MIPSWNWALQLLAANRSSLEGSTLEVGRSMFHHRDERA